jgi:two-component system response regulator YesN
VYKAIIVDDEPLVRSGLRNTINWQEHGFELVGDYTNGVEALEAVELHKPDLVLSDIYMPFMNGLELSGRISAQYPYIKVIILTGYDEFEYAQQALRLKVHDFILKPITARETQELLDKVKREMDEETKRREDIGRLHNQLTQSLPLLKERFLERLVVTGIGAQSLDERFAYFGLPRLSPRYLVMVLDIDDFGEPKSGSNEGDRELLRFAVYNILEEIVQRENGHLFRTREERMAVIVSGQTEDDPLYEKAFRIAEVARHHTERFLKFTVTVGVGRSCVSPEQLPASYKSALSALEYRFLLGKNRVLSILDLEGHVSAGEYHVDWDRKLASTLKTGSEQDAVTLIELIVKDLKSSLLPLDACLLQIQKIVFALLNTLQELGLTESGAAGGQQILFTGMFRFKTLDEVESWLKTVVHNAISAIADNRNHLTHMQIVKAMAFIEEHYADEGISLQELCRHVLMSTSNFSLVFKQHTGATFVEYLTRVRIEKAKELLQFSSLKFYEIATRVGYGDPNYFSILFKKQTGLTPSEYKDKLTKGNPA